MLKQRTGLLSALTTVTALMLCAPLSADFLADNPLLPPVGGVYLTPADVHAQYTDVALEIILNRPEHRFFRNIQRLDEGNGNEREIFDSTLLGTADINSLALSATDVPIQLDGPVQTIVFGRTDNPTGTFDTEIVSMQLSGNVGGLPIVIRESPVHQSQGLTTITDIGGGEFLIDSFFDVFTELSLDGGTNWISAAAPVRVNLVPEPSTFVLAAFGLLGLGTFGRRGAKKTI